MLLFALLLVLPLAVAGALANDPAPAAAPFSVLIVERTPTGTVERTGYVIDLHYAPPSLLVEFVDDGDALFHNDFEVPLSCQ
jgi:hypothetical protein